MEGQEKRIDQLNSEIDHSLAILGVLLVLAGVISFFSFRNTARKQALEEVNAWFSKHEEALAIRKDALTQEMESFKQQILELQEQTQEQAIKIREMMSDLEDKLLNESDELIKKINISRQAHDSLKTNTEKLTQSEAALLAKAADKTQHKPEEERTFADWNRLAFAADGSNEKEKAINLWQKALEASDANDTQIAESLFNIGATWRKIEKDEKAVEVYERLLQRYGDSTVPSVQEQCAKALYNKGWTLGEKLNDPEGEVLVYGDLLERYGDSTVPDVQESCATALLNKGWTLREKLNDPVGAVSVFGELLKRFGDSTVPGVQEQCAKALFNKGVTLGEKFNDWAGAVLMYGELLKRFGDSTVLGTQETCATALVNKGVALGRLDDLSGAISCYSEVLARYSKSENPIIREQYQFAEANAAELLLVLGRNTEGIPRLRQVLARTDVSSQEYVIMHFLLWLAEADTSLVDVLDSIHALPLEVKFTWNWTDIRPLVDKLPKPRKTQAECFIAFFEKHHDIATLEACLEVRGYT